MTNKRLIFKSIFVLFVLSQQSGLALAAEPTEYRECDVCPVMVTIPAGEFDMGSPEDNPSIEPRTGKPIRNESPQHRVRFAESFDIGKYEVTVAEYGAFIRESGYKPAEGCIDFSPPDPLAAKPDVDWSKPGYEQTGDMPVVCIGQTDATAYAAWLREKTGSNYRLPSEAEWEYAARGGETSRQLWGDDVARSCEYANLRTELRPSDKVPEGYEPECTDDYRLPSPVGSFAPNGFGIHDVIGNVWEWVADCSHENYEGAPEDGSAWIDGGNCDLAMMRGGAYGGRPSRYSLAIRAGRPRQGNVVAVGFRVAKGQSAGGTTVAMADAADKIDASGSGTGPAIYREYCLICHSTKSTLPGDYGTDQQSVEAVTRFGGQNGMSMPPFGTRITEEELEAVSSFVRAQMGWN